MPPELANSSKIESEIELMWGKDFAGTTLIYVDGNFYVGVGPQHPNAEKKIEEYRSAHPDTFQAVTILK